MIINNYDRLVDWYLGYLSRKTNIIICPIAQAVSKKIKCYQYNPAIIPS